MDFLTRKKYKIILFLGIIGVTTIIYSLIQKNDKISTFNTGQTEITLINLNANNESNYLLFIGSLLFIFSLTLLLIKHFSENNKSANDQANLTRKENEILICIEKGYSNKEISNELSISVSTVKTHINNIFKKKKVTKRDHLIQKRAK